MFIVEKSARVALRTGLNGMGVELRPRRLAIGAFVLAASVGASSPLNAESNPKASCAAAPTQALRVHVINAAGAPSETIEIALAEASEIWAKVGLDLTWTFPPATPNAGDGRSVNVIIRRELTPPRVAGEGRDGRVHTPLGWLTFGDDGQPGTLIEISYDAVSTLVKKGSHMDRAVTALPDFARNPIFGRGLGRVIAHELGHWLMGRGHVSEGLMKARFGAQDLVAWKMPDLPSAWTAVNAEQNAVAARCVPMALHRLVADE